MKGTKDMKKKGLGVMLSLLVVCSIAFQGVNVFVYAEDINTTPTKNVTQEINSQVKIVKVNNEKVQNDQQQGAETEEDAENNIKSGALSLRNQTRRAPTVKAPAKNAKELTKVISDIKLWDTNEGRYVTKTNDTYQLVKGSSYRFETDFDLSAYNGDLENGDTFTLTVPEPFTVKDGTIALTHKETGIAIGAATVTSNGEGKGGTVKVTLQNLDKYLEKTGADEVRDLKGTFYVNFTASEIMTEKTVTYNTTETADVITHKITVKEKGTTDYTEAIGKANFSKFGGVLENRPYTSEKLGKSGTYVHPWYVRVNVRQASYNNITVVDSISKEHAPMQYIPETAKVIYGYYDSTYSFHKEGELTEGVDYSIEYNSSYTDFELKILNASPRMASNGKPASYQLSYSTTAPADGSTVANTVEVYGDETQLTVNTDSTQTSTTTIRNSKITEGGTITLDVGYRIVLYKVDESTGNMLAGAVFKVTTPGGEEITLPATDATGRTYSRIFTSQEASQGDFTITEVTAPDGFKLLKEPIKVKVGSEGAIKTISNEPKEISVKVNKKWIGKEGGAVTVHLYADGEDTGKAITLDAANGWADGFDGLRQYRTNGEEIKYTIKEDVPAGYEDKVTGSQKDGYTITNTNVEKISIPVKKSWVGKKTDSVTVKLLADKKDTGKTITLHESGQWKGSFSDLPKYDSVDGHKINYTIEEVKLDGYNSVVCGTAETGFTVTNTITGKVSIPVTKTWVGKEGDSAEIRLYADGTEVDSVTLNKSNNWQHTFTNLEKYKDGEEINYTIKEDSIENYKSEITGNAASGYTVKNINTEKVSVPVTKQWVGKETDQVKVKLLADNVEKDTATLTANGNWKHTFKDLPKYDETDGHEIVYTMAEVKVDGYTTGISGTAENGFTITNTISGKVSVPVTKKWVGGATDNITVNLYADGKKIDTQKLSKDNHWQYTFKDLDQYKDGKEIAYTIKEEKVSGYTTAINGDAKKGFVITNTRDTPKTPANTPDTGDNSNLLLYGGIIIASLGFILFLIGKKRKQI